MRHGRFFGALFILLLAPVAVAGMEQTTIGVAPSDGLSMLVKRFSVATGTTIVGAECQNNDSRTIFPEVLLVRGVGDAISQGTVVARVANASETAAGVVTISWPQAIQTVQNENYYLAVRMPAG